MAAARRHQCEATGCCAICFGLWKEPTTAATSAAKAKRAGDGAGGSSAADHDMIQCDKCDLWVHVACEGLPKGSSEFFAQPDATYAPRHLPGPPLAAPAPRHCLDAATRVPTLYRFYRSRRFHRYHCPDCSDAETGRGVELFEASRRRASLYGSQPTSEQARANPWTLAVRPLSTAFADASAGPANASATPAYHPSSPVPTSDRAFCAAAASSASARDQGTVQGRAADAPAADLAAFRAAVVAAAAKAKASSQVQSDGDVDDVDRLVDDVDHMDAAMHAPPPSVEPPESGHHADTSSALGRSYIAMKGGAGKTMPLIVQATLAPPPSASSPQLPKLPTYGLPWPGFDFDPATCSYVPIGPPNAALLVPSPAVNSGATADANPPTTLDSTAMVAPLPPPVDPAAAAAAAERHAAAAAATRARYEACAAAFEPLSASNVERKMLGLNAALEAVYGDLPFINNDWGTSILGTLVGLICAQTCRNSWSSIGYSNLAATFPSASLRGEPDWDLIRRRRPEHIEPCIWHGPYFHMKAERIHALLTRAFDDSGGVATSLERLHTWPSERIRSYLMSINGISGESTPPLAPRPLLVAASLASRTDFSLFLAGKSVACLLLYRMGRVDFAVDANVLRVMTRLGWLKKCPFIATVDCCPSTATLPRATTGCD